ncbi:MAG: hypothetical protein DRP08_01490 [Candidatus Aenigmatarchaeota archaeon]|nr:MAG: hypothetical protein DRP08_01490 [Candidatus Aenigmarchaeota archaeon]
MSDKKIRISEELYDQLTKIAEKSGRSMRDLVEEAIRAYLLGTESVEKPIKSIQGKIIPLQYPSRCFFCKRQIKQGELAYWAKYTYSDNTTKSYVICLDCYYKDTALAEWYLKKKKLEAIVRGLKKQADELAEKVNRLRTEYDVMSIRKEVASLWNEFKQYMLTPNSSVDSDKLQEFIDRVNELIDKLTGIEASLRVEVGISKKKKGVAYAKERTM